MTHVFGQEVTITSTVGRAALHDEKVLDKKMVRRIGLRSDQYRQ